MFDERVETEPLISQMNSYETSKKKKGSHSRHPIAHHLPILSLSQTSKQTIDHSTNRTSHLFPGSPIPSICIATWVASRGMIDRYCFVYFSQLLHPPPISPPLFRTCADDDVEDQEEKRAQPSPSPTPIAAASLTIRHVKMNLRCCNRFWLSDRDTRCCLTMLCDFCLLCFEGWDCWMRLRGLEGGATYTRVRGSVQTRWVWKGRRKLTQGGKGRVR